MNLRDEEIEAAARSIKEVILENNYERWISNGKQQQYALEQLDALCCAAARQPKSLVGKRVAVRAFSTTLVGTIAKESRVWIVKHKGSQAGPVAPGELTLFEGDDFKVLEGDNAE